MTALSLCILFNVAIFLTFKAFGAWHVRNAPAIVVNYGVAVVVGLVFGRNLLAVEHLPPAPALWLAVLFGALFMTVFVLLAFTSRTLGVGPAVVAGKLSMVIPIGVALVVVPGAVEDMTALRWASLPLAVLAVVLSSWRPQAAEQHHNRWLLALPVVIFFAGGLIDSLLNYTNLTYLTARSEAVYPILIFGVAAVVGTGYLLVVRTLPSRKEVLAGAWLGLINYFSVYFLLAALREYGNNGALVFPLNNLAIILLSSLGAVALFGERPRSINLVGLVLALASLTMLVV